MTPACIHWLFAVYKSADERQLHPLSAAQWARSTRATASRGVHPDDAATRGDRAMVDEALYRIGSATRFDDRFSISPAPSPPRRGRQMRI